MAALPLFVLVAFAGVVAVRMFSVIKGWQNVRRWRSPVSWSDIPVTARVFVIFIAAGGLVCGVLLGMAAHGH
jgi:hypothetical protein